MGNGAGGQIGQSIEDRLRSVCEEGADPDLVYEAADEIARLRKDADRYRWMMAHLDWTVAYKKPHPDIMRYQMRNGDERWGQWHNTPGDAIDAAMVAG